MCGPGTSWKRLDSSQADLPGGGLAAEAAAGQVAPGYDFLEGHREGLALLTNLPVREIAAKAVGVERLRTLPLVIPSGVITGFVERWYGPDFRSQIQTAAETGPPGPHSGIPGVDRAPHPASGRQ
ncbi:hypothetical protein OG462_42090 [Streptomyces sp. NBC_01077]|uniref:hypothetical protein n=1 Tax=Streptomyces sp. NBC_01077 TaxID=2903746 RepID=UPI003868ACF0|nr:hypothetical protein OG462_02930 [Streptomyces sp. NBC_01077]WSV43458.1 hypothetical protein OG462_42090 [Streptomyces sp. NBC_01077]